MARKRRQSELFSMSFLDCMCCGFGAVILLFMIINSQIKEQIDFNKTIPKSEINSLKIQILQEKKNLVLARNSIDDIKDKDNTITDELARLVILLNKLKIELEKSNIDSIAKNEEIEKLKADIEKLSQE